MPRKHKLVDPAVARENRRQAQLKNAEKTRKPGSIAAKRKESKLRNCCEICLEPATPPLVANMGLCQKCRDTYYQQQRAIGILLRDPPPDEIRLAPILEKYLKRKQRR